jgi:hypothetical protein
VWEYFVVHRAAILVPDYIAQDRFGKLLVTWFLKKFPNFYGNRTLIMHDNLPLVSADIYLILFNFSIIWKG